MTKQKKSQGNEKAKPVEVNSGCQGTVFERIAHVAAEVGTIAKTIGPEGQGWKSYSIDVAVGALRESMLKHGLVLVVESHSMTMTTHRLTRDDGGERLVHEAMCQGKLIVQNISMAEDRVEVPISGQGLDHSDKSTGKAIAYAAKPALLFLFMLRGHPDVEGDDIEKPEPLFVGRAPWECPNCGAKALHQGKGKVGYNCWKSKGGCEFFFPDDEAIRAARRERDAARPATEEQREALRGWVKVFPKVEFGEGVAFEDWLPAHLESLTQGKAARIIQGFEQMEAKERGRVKAGEVEEPQDETTLDDPEY